VCIVRPQHRLEDRARRFPCLSLCLIASPRPCVHVSSQKCLRSRHISYKAWQKEMQDIPSNVLSSETPSPCLNPRYYLPLLESRPDQTFHYPRYSCASNFSHHLDHHSYCSCCRAASKDSSFSLEGPSVAGPQGHTLAISMVGVVLWRERCASVVR